MKFSIFLNPQIPPGLDKAGRRRLAPLGRKTPNYQMMLQEVREIAVHADKIGFDAIMLTEHHFHSEGYEASVNPLLLLADLAARTERIMLAPLGMVLPAWDPIRAAEDVAILDQLCKGRLALGIARGYQKKWSSTLFQTRQVDSSSYSSEEVEARNQEVFSEMLKIMKMCWTQDTVRYQSDVLGGYSIPYPYEGIADWPAKHWTREYGAPGEIDDDGVVRHVSVIPRPYQEPHPPFWQPFAISERTLRRCAEMGIMPYILAPLPADFRRKCEQFQKAAAEYGRDLALGEDTGTLNHVMIGDRAEMLEIASAAIVPDWVSFFGSFGYLEALRKPEDPWPRGQFPASEATAERFDDVGLIIAGDVDTCKRRMHEIVSAAPPDWFGYSLPGLQGNMPIEWVKRQLELFAEHIIPEFR